MSAIISLLNSLPFGNPAEKGYWLYKNVPAGVLEGLEHENFKKTIQFVSENSAFYKRKFAERGIDAKKITKPEDLGDFFTTPEDIRQNPEEFICLKPDTAYETTGTTSKRTKRVYFSRNEVADAGWAGAVGLWGVGLRPEDRVASAFDYSFWVSGPVLVASCGVLGCFHVEAGRIPPEEFYDRLKDYKLTVIVGDPSWVLRLSEVAAQKGAWPLKLIIASGENFTEEARSFVEQVWKCPMLLSYGQTEAFGAIGMESLAKEGYHLNEFHNFFEIINRDEQGYGELVYTTSNRRVMPLVRYRSGDITRFIDGAAKSGLPGRRIEKLKGRIDEWIPTGMGNVAPWMFDSLFASVPGLSADWQLLITKKNNKDFLEFHLEQEIQGPENGLKQEVLKRFESELSDAWKMNQMGLFEWAIALHPKGTLRSGRKLVRILDQRKF